MKHLLPLLALGILPVSAQSISTDDAHQLARQFFVSHGTNGAHHAPAKVEPVLAYTATTDGTADLYVFNRAADVPGFVVISADDTAMPVLGYSDNSTFDLATAPTNFLWWLEQYQRNGVTKTLAKAGETRHDIAPLVTTEWGQDDPYNVALPRLTSTSKRFVTGCTATAMAQVMKYFNYPTYGKGSHSYQTHTWNTSQGQVTPTFQANFEATRYDWGNMLDSYNGNYNQTQANAVATLMYHAGVAEDADYGQNATSASDLKSGIALIEHFRYSKAMLRGDRDFFTDDQWDNTIYQELAAGRPVLYAGSTTKGEGHAFVCDGYEASTGHYHINWGWDGISNGYFALTGDDALYPDVQGTGGAASGLGYTESQSINYNILATEEGEYPIQAASYDHFIVGTNPAVTTTFTSKTIDRSRANADIPVYFRLTSYNYGFSTINIKSGVLLRHTATDTTYGQIGIDTPMQLGPSQYVEYSYGSEYAHFNTSTAPYNGTYEIIPACTTDNGVTWHPMAIRATDSYPTITITGGEDAQAVELPFTISASEVEVGKTITIAPHNDFHGNVVYTSSDPTIASVSAAGVITGVKEGHATITAASEETSAFLATTKTFDIDVVAHIMQNVDVTLDKRNLMVGETTNISLTKAYDGEVTYTVAPEGIVSVSADGLVTALAEGEATITVNVAGNYDFRPAKKQFDVTVSNSPANTGTFEFADYPTAGDNNIVTDNLTVSLPVVNNASTTLAEGYVYYYFEYNDRYYVARGTGYGSIPSGYKNTISLDFNSLLNSMERGKTYTMYFYRDNKLSVPMNVPSLTFYYAPEDAAIGNVSRLIKEAKDNAEIKPQLIKSLVSKVLEK